MASRKAPATRSPRTTMGTPSEQSRSEKPRQGRASASAQRKGTEGPAEKKHKNLAEVQATGRQSDQGGQPGAGKRRPTRG